MEPHSPRHPTKAQRQAAIWSAKLRRVRITNEELREFWRWREREENAEAFQRLLERDG